MNQTDLFQPFHGTHNERLLPSRSDSFTSIQLTRAIHPEEVAAFGLSALWKVLGFAEAPLIFRSPPYRRVYLEHHPHFLQQHSADNHRRKRGRFGQLEQWQFLPPPSCADSLAAVPFTGELLTATFMQKAQAGQRGAVFNAPRSWCLYTFASGWSALSVHFDDTDRDAATLVALPEGRQDEWLAFLNHLDSLQAQMLRRHRRGHIEIEGDDGTLERVIKHLTIDDVILPETLLKAVAAERAIFTKPILNNYARLDVPRLRKVLLIGPPGTGKTTLLKYEAGLHARNGGLVLYVSAAKNERQSSWQRLALALADAAECRLPTLIVVEDFELFVSHPDERQLVLNTLDGLATPDNPAGTLLLASSNNPDMLDFRIRDRPGRIDRIITVGNVNDIYLVMRFLKRFLGAVYCEERHAPFAAHLLNQAGSHIREVCLASLMHAAAQGRTEVLFTDLQSAHENILKGREQAANPENCSPTSTKERPRFFGKGS